MYIKISRYNETVIYFVHEPSKKIDLDEKFNEYANTVD